MYPSVKEPVESVREGEAKVDVGDWANLPSFTSKETNWIWKTLLLWFFREAEQSLLTLLPPVLIYKAQIKAHWSWNPLKS